METARLPIEQVIPAWILADCIRTGWDTRPIRRDWPEFGEAEVLAAMALLGAERA